MQLCKPIFSYLDQEKLAEHQQQLKKDENVREYVKNCINGIKENLDKTFGKNYVTHKVFWVDQEGGFSDCRCSPLVNSNRYANEIIDLCTQLIKDGQAESITRNILNQKITGALIYHGDISCCEYKQHLALFDLESIQRFGPDQGDKDLVALSNACTWDAEKLEKFSDDLFIGDPEKIKPILIGYKKISKKIKGTFYAYFIRPFRKDDIYNGAMVLLLRKPIDERVFNEIGMFLSHVFMETALHKVDRLKNDLKQRLLTGEQHHNLKHVLGCVKSYLGEAIAANESVLQKKVHDALWNVGTHIDLLITFLNFSHYLMKVDENGEAIDSNKRNEFEGKYPIAEVNLSEVFQRQINIINRTLKDLAFNTREHSANMKQFLTKMIAEDSFYRNLPVIKVIPAAFEMVLHELLKNALLHTDTSKPSITIEYKQLIDGHYDTLTITNNYRVKNQAYDFMQTNKESTHYSIQHKVGIRFAKRIFDLTFFNHSGKSEKRKWKMETIRSSQNENWTSVVLSIPKSDIINPTMQKEETPDQMYFT